MLHVLLALFLCAGLAPARAVAHDIPEDVRIRAFVQPSGATLRLLIRVPMAAMQDVDFPRRGPGYLDFARADATLREAADLWLADNIELYEGGKRLPRPRLVDARVSLPSDTSFTSLERALAHLRSPGISPETDLYWNQGLLDVLFEYPIASEASEFSIHPRLARLGIRVATSLTLVMPGGVLRPFEFHGSPGLVHLDPRWTQAAGYFAVSGFLHILRGTDHLLFLLCVVIPFRRMRPLIVIVTSFTLAHSVTLVASALGFAPSALWFAPLIEALIAASVLYMALENIVGARLQRRWALTFVFGLVHGFGFAFVLQETLQFAGSHLALALATFNLGVEFGQLAALVVLVQALTLLFRAGVAERTGTIVLSALVAHTAWHWLGERTAQLARFPWPTMDAATGASALRWALAAVGAGVVLWGAHALLVRTGWLAAEKKSSRQ